MEATQISSKKVTTKKAHKCHFCNTEYPKGEVMICTVNAHEDIGIYSLYCCNICDKFLNQLDEPIDFDMGLQQGDIWNWDEYKPFRENLLTTNP